MLLLYDNTGGDLNKISMLTVASGYNQMWFRNWKYTFFSDFINPIGTADFIGLCNYGSDLTSAWFIKSKNDGTGGLNGINISELASDIYMQGVIEYEI